MKSILQLLITIICTISIILANSFDQNIVSRSYYSAGLSSSYMAPDGLSEKILLKRKSLLRAGHIAGTLFGTAFGFIHISSWATDNSGATGPAWKNIGLAIPSIICGCYVGNRMTEWALIKIIDDKPKPLKASAKGALYGMIDGAAIGAASLIPLVTLGYVTKVIHFNESMGSFAVLKLAAAGALVGGGVGAAAGLGIGLISGPGISIYMNF